MLALATLVALATGGAAKADAALNSQEQALANLVIANPGQHLGPMQLDATLCAVAHAKAADMARRRYYAHVDPDGHGANWLVRNAGYPLPAWWGTDPAANYIESLDASEPTAGNAWNAWMGSPGHKAHILATTAFYRDQTSFGVGYYYDAASPWRHYWVILTAPPRGPTLSIASPLANAALTVPQVTVSGTTGGAPAAAKVQVRLENAAGTGAYVNASGVTNWSAAIPGLIAGPNTLRVRSVAGDGQTLVELTRVVRHVVLRPLNVAVDGSGTVSAGFLGTSQRELDATFTISAAPAAGWLFSGWTGGVTSTSAKLTLKMIEGLTLTAHFIPNPFLAHKGAYNGMIVGATSAHAANGLFKITVAAGGTFTGRLTIGGLGYAVSGKFNARGDATITVKRGALTPVVVTLHLDLDGGTDRITGSVTDGTFTSAISADRGPVASTVPHALTGRYTISLPPNAAHDPLLPSGNGYATLLVSKAGLATLSGALADGKTFTASATIAKDGSFPLYVPLYSGKGSIASRVTFRDTGVADLDGTFHWSKPLRALDRYYPQAFEIDAPILGSRYAAPLAGQTVVAVAAGSNNSELQLGAGDLEPSVVQAATLTPKNTVTVTAPVLKLLKVTIVPSTGRFSGSFTHPLTKTTSTIRGVIFQRQNAGFGFFLGKDESGYTSLAPTN